MVSRGNEQTSRFEKTISTHFMLHLVMLCSTVPHMAMSSWPNSNNNLSLYIIHRVCRVCNHSIKPPRKVFIDNCY